MHSNEFTGIQLGGQLGERFAHQVHFSAGMNLHIVAGGRYPVDAVDRNEVCPRSIAYQDLLDGRRLPRHCAKHAPHALF